jgi:hypothetical protein
MFKTQLVKSLTAALAIFVASAASAATIDTTTQGNWIGVYGKGGYILNAFNGGGNGNYLGAASTANDLVSLPNFISSYSYSSNAQQYVWATGTTDVRALQDPAHPSVPSDRNAATTFNGGDYSVTLNVSKATDFNLSVYALDWDNFNGRDITLSINGLNPVEVNNTTPGLLGAYHNGEWVTWNINAPVGPLTIDIHQNASGASNSVISAIMFTPEPSSMVLFGLGAIGLVAAARHQRRV